MYNKKLRSGVCVIATATLRKKAMFPSKIPIPGKGQSKGSVWLTELAFWDM